MNLQEAGERALSVTPAKPATTVVKRQPDGAQLFAILKKGETAARFALGLPAGATLVPRGGGYVITRHAGSSIVEVLGSIAEPWAVDAEGKRVPTTFEFSGGELTQRIHPTTNVTYPVVADPRLTYGLGIYLNLYGGEIKALATAIIGAGGTAIMVGCSDVSAKLPSLVTKAIKLLCTAVGGLTVKQVFDTIVQLWRSGQVSIGACYQTRILPEDHRLVRVKEAGNCRP